MRTFKRQHDIEFEFDGKVIIFHISYFVRLLLLLVRVDFFHGYSFFSVGTHFVPLFIRIVFTAIEISFTVATHNGTHICECVLLHNCQKWLCHVQSYREWKRERERYWMAEIGGKYFLPVSHFNFLSVFLWLFLRILSHYNRHVNETFFYVLYKFFFNLKQNNLCFKYAHKYECFLFLWMAQKWCKMLKFGIRYTQRLCSKVLLFYCFYFRLKKILKWKQRNFVSKKRKKKQTKSHKIILFS